MFYDMLNEHYDPTQRDIKDILSEVFVLKQMLLKKDENFTDKFSYTFRCLQEDINRFLKDICEFYFGTLEKGVKEKLKNSEFDIFLQSNNISFKIDTMENVDEYFKSKETLDRWFELGILSLYNSVLPYRGRKSSSSIDSNYEYDVPKEPLKDNRVIFSIGKQGIVGNRNAYNLIEAMYNKVGTYDDMHKPSRKKRGYRTEKLP